MSTYLTRADRRRLRRAKRPRPPRATQTGPAAPPEPPQPAADDVPGRRTEVRIHPDGCGCDER